MNKLLRYFLIIGLSFCVKEHLLAQDSIFVNHPFLNKYAKNYIGLVLFDSVKFTATNYWSTFEPLIFGAESDKEKFDLKKKGFVFKDRVIIKNCIINEPGGFLQDIFYLPNEGLATYSFLNSVYIQNSIFPKNLNLSYFHTYEPGVLTLEKNKAKAIQILNSSGLLNVSQNEISDSIIILNSTFTRFNFLQNRFSSKKGGNRIFIENSRFANTDLVNTISRNLYVEFHRDTLNGDFKCKYEAKVKTDLNNRYSFNFKNTIINCAFKLSKIDCPNNVKFDDCIFGPDANLNNLACDSLVFNNCYNLPNPIYITVDSSKNVTNISFINTNLVNIKFDYNEKLKLFFNPTATQDAITSTYENLLAKFKIEGKFESFKNVEIEYKQYKYSLDGWVGSLQNKIDRLWWNYGYSKWYILLWSLFFLMFFFISNLFLWREMQKIYPTIINDNSTGNHRLKKNARKAVVVFLYTSFIFFSLKVDFEKLKFHKTRFIGYFFIQYMVGLICIFFIVNAILKI